MSKINLFQEQERERRFRIIEAGLNEDFWKITYDSLLHWNAVKMQEIVDLHMDGRHEDAQRLALVVGARQMVMQEPSVIVKANKSLFDKFVTELCHSCGHITKKLKQVRENFNKTDTHGG